MTTTITPNSSKTQNKYNLNKKKIGWKKKKVSVRDKKHAENNFKLISCYTDRWKTHTK